MPLPIEEIYQDLETNYNFEEFGSVEKARKFISAAIAFLFHPDSQSDQGSSLGWDFARVENQLNYARLFVAQSAKPTSSQSSRVRVIAPSIGFRR